MDLIETSIVADGDLPVAAFREHLRLGTGFADAASGDALLVQYLRAALAAIETRTGKALMQRSFRLTLTGWRWPDAQALPVAPVSAVASVTLIDAAGGASVVDSDRWRLMPDRHRPQIVATGAVLPMPQSGGRIEVAFTAGFGLWADLPADLKQAVLLLAAQYYEGRTGGTDLPGTVAPLLARWLPVRVTAGGHR